MLEGRESVDWLIKHPLPLFLGVMDKKTLTFRVYHTAPRFYPWALGDCPDRLELTTTKEEWGRARNGLVSTSFLSCQLFLSRWRGSRATATTHKTPAMYWNIGSELKTGSRPHNG